MPAVCKRLRLNMCLQAWTSPFEMDAVAVVIVVSKLDRLDSGEDSTLEDNFSSIRVTLTDEESFFLSVGVSSK